MSSFAAIINNDSELLAFLLENGANLYQKDVNHGLTPEEFTEFLARKDPSIDRENIKRQLSEHKITGITKAQEHRLTTDQ